ncbi:hypothetical protein RvY_13249 [Ramazzottius varieornatus]|uniref:Conserved oligomeric Golgi complex subunit 8 n=1 Tax=Ramazzottius varieornatus TaxID=947166 RepID=A0A1D1VVT1_RAMVA|nr:hypothetical protein RvY_13249 [Ramazzottius varieornatus]
MTEEKGRVDSVESASNLFIYLQSVLGQEENSANVAISGLSEDDFAYGEELLRTDLHKVETEEKILQEISRDIHAKKAALVLENYSVLLDASHRLEEISKDVPEIKTRLNKALVQYSDTEKLNNEFVQRVASFTADRTNSQKELAQLPLIQDLLEIPFLMYSLSKAGLLDEAVELVFFVDKLSHQAPSNQAISLLAEQSRQRAWILMNLLSNQLRTTFVQLLEALKIVSLQRRLGTVLGISVEEYIRTNFLQSKSIYISSLVRAAPHKEPYHSLTKVLEICRLHYFDTMNGYLSVFPDNPNLPSTLRVLPYLWLQNELSELCSLVRKSLLLVEETRLESLYNQCSNLAEALTRFGSNIANVLYETFVDFLVENLRTDFRKATDEFSQKIPTAVKKPRPTLRLHQDRLVNETTLTPPEELLDFPLLAELCNAVLSALNRLRHCYFPNLFPVIPVMSHLSALLDQTSTALTEYSQTDARQVLTDLEDYYLRFFVPFVEEVRSKMCPVQQVAAVLGISIQEASNLFPTSFSRSRTDSVLVLENNVEELRTVVKVTNGHSLEGDGFPVTNEPT